MTRQNLLPRSILAVLGRRLLKRQSCAARNHRRALHFEPFEDRIMLAGITVTSPADDGGGLKITLREAIAQANANDEADVITFSTNPADGLNGATINLTQELSITEAEGIIIDASMLSLGLTISGQHGTNHVAGDGDGFTIFNIGSGSVEINSLTLTGGDASILEWGGAISVLNANLTVKNSTIIDNATTSVGGGIQFVSVGQNELNIINSTISGNMAENDSLGSGGGLFAFGNEVSVNITQSSVITGNQTGGVGGGIFANVHSFNLQSSKVQNNRSTRSGGGLSILASDGANVTINNSMIDAENRTTGGFADAGGVTITAYSSTVSITSSTISGNKALGNEANVGGAEIIANDGSTVLLDYVAIVDNHADDDVGGLVISNTGSIATVRNSIISGNTAIHNAILSYNAAGGAWLAAYNSGSKNYIENTTVSGNHSTFNGAGLFVRNAAGTTTSILNSTISGNRADEDGGGIKIDDSAIQGGEVIIRHSTITNNRSDFGAGANGSGGGIHIGNSSTTLSLDHTIVAGNFRGSGTTRDDISGTVTASWSLIGDKTGTTLAEAPVGSPDANGNMIGGPTNGAIDPKLGPLRNNGGPVFLDGSRMLTHAPIPTSMFMNPGSPAINAGNTNTSGFPQYDQRGATWSRVVTRIDIGAIELQANLLEGDYDFDGDVDAADYTIWRDTLDSTMDLRADADGSGKIDAEDYKRWKAAFGGGTGSVLADFNENGATDIADYFLWSSTEGSTTDLRADCNEDGIVDDADYEIWFDTFGSTLEIAHFGLLSGMFDPDAPPVVVGFALSLPGDVTIDFADRVGTGDQIRSVPLTAANTVSVTFSQDVVITQGALQITNLDGTSPTVSAFSYDAAAQTATWTFASALANGRYVMRLSDAVENLDGKALDGEFFNPTKLSDDGTAVFPSGDGDEGGEFRFRFTVLLGDDNHDNIYGAANYQNWQSTEPGMIIVSTTADDYDSDLSFGDVSLREAVNYANTAGSATAIQLPAGRYALTRTGTEGTATAYNDLDVLAAMTIQGAGAGLSVIVPGWSYASYNDDRLIEVRGAAADLKLRGVTLANSDTAAILGMAAQVQNQAKLEIVDSAIVNNSIYDTAIAVHSMGAYLTIRRSVFTNNEGYDGSAVYAAPSGGYNGSLTIGESIFALNTRYANNGNGSTPNVSVASGVALTNLGKNLYDNAGGGFFNVVSGTGDYLGTPQYVVTTVADEFDHSDDGESLSLREAIDLANQASGAKEIWVPAWRFVLTRDRGTNATDTDVSYGDLDVKNSMSIRGVDGRTSIEWKAGVVDKAIELLGDVNRNGVVDAADYSIWQDQNGASGAWEQFAADVDDDGDVDEDDYDLWSANFGHTLTLTGIEV